MKFKSGDLVQFKIDYFFNCLLVDDSKGTFYKSVEFKAGTKATVQSYLSYSQELVCLKTDIYEFVALEELLEFANISVPSADNESLWDKAAE